MKPVQMAAKYRRVCRIGTALVTCLESLEDLLESEGELEVEEEGHRLQFYGPIACGEVKHFPAELDSDGTMLPGWFMVGITNEGYTIELAMTADEIKAVARDLLAVLAVHPEMAP